MYRFAPGMEAAMWVFPSVRPSVTRSPSARRPPVHTSSARHPSSVRPSHPSVRPPAWGADFRGEGLTGFVVPHDDAGRAPMEAAFLQEYGCLHPDFWVGCKGSPRGELCTPPARDLSAPRRSFLRCSKKSPTTGMEAAMWVCHHRPCRTSHLCHPGR